MMQNDNELLEAIHAQMRVAWFSRTKLDPDEIVNEVYVRLKNGSNERTTVPSDGEILAVVRHAVRDFTRAVRPSRDIDSIPESEHPFRDESEEIHVREFEETYSRFCNSLNEPQRTICLKFRTLARRDLAMLANVSVQNVSETLKNLPAMFERFMKSSR